MMTFDSRTEIGKPELGRAEGTVATVCVNPNRHRGLLSSSQGGLAGALSLLLWDAVLSGSFLMSMLACPLWFLVSVAQNAAKQPGWRIALFRIAIPVVTLAIVLANNALQWRIAEANAGRVIKACRDYRVAHGDYPTQLDILVPDYLDSVPRAKYCVMWGDFVYWSR